MTRWRCRRYQPWLVDRVDGVLDTSRQQRLEQHLTGCSACRADLEALRDLPEAMRTSTVHDPGDAFWLHQRQAIGRTIRNLPAPRSGWQLDRLQALRLGPWRYPLAATIALLLALSVYQVAERPPETGGASIGAQLATLDSEVLLALDDLAAALTPTDDSLHYYTPREDEIAFAALAVGDLVGTHTLSHVPDEIELGDADLEGMGELVGGIG